MKNFLISQETEKKNQKIVGNVLFIDKKLRNLQNWKMILNIHFV